MVYGDQTLIPLEREPGSDGAGGEPRTTPLDRGQSPGPGSRAILERIVRGDPLGMAGRCRRRLRERALLISLRRLVARSLATVARAASLESGVDPTGEVCGAWLERCVDQALDELLLEDRRIPAAPRDPRYRFAAAPLGVSSDRARGVLVAFNALPRAERRRYWSAFIEPGAEAARRSRTSAPTAAHGRGCPRR